MATTGYNQDQLRALKRKGALIVNQDGYEVRYQPTRQGCRFPWLRVGKPDEMKNRSRSGQCYPEAPNGGPWALAELLVISTD